MSVRTESRTGRFGVLTLTVNTLKTLPSKTECHVGHFAVGTKGGGGGKFRTTVRSPHVIVIVSTYRLTVPKSVLSSVRAGRRKHVDRPRISETCHFGHGTPPTRGQRELRPNRTGNVRAPFDRVRLRASRNDRTRDGVRPAVIYRRRSVSLLNTFPECPCENTTRVLYGPFGRVRMVRAKKLDGKTELVGKRVKNVRVDKIRFIQFLFLEWME